MDQPDTSPESLPPCICKACGEAANYHLGRKNGYDLEACTHCGTVTVNPFPTAEELREFYQQYKGTPGYLTKRESKIKRITKRLKRLTRMFKFDPKGKKFLDVGCNVGYAVAAAKGLGFDAFGIDIDEDAVATAKEHFGAENFAPLSVEDYAASGKKAQVIHTSEVIEHVPDPHSFVRALAEILIPGGILYLTTPDGNHFMLPQNFTRWEACTPPEHIVYFSRKGLKILLEANGFKVRKFFFNFKPGIKVVAIRKKDATA